MKPDERQPVLASVRPHRLPEPVALIAWNGSGHGSLNMASDSDSFEAPLPREPHGVAMGIAAFMAVATPTPVPNRRVPEAKATPSPLPTPYPWETPVPGFTPTPRPADSQGCHRWQYALRWEQPSRLAILKNVLGDSVTTYTAYTAPGNGNQNDWPDPTSYNPSGIGHSEIPSAWNYKAPSGAGPTVGGPWAHNCDDPGAPPCALLGEQPGISYSKGTWDWPDPNSNDLKSNYDPAWPPFYHPGADTTGSSVYEEPTFPLVLFPAPYGTAGTYDGWAWTLNYGYGAAPNNDVIYGPDPGPPFTVMDETTDNSCGLGCGNSIPGFTGTPISFPVSWTNAAGVNFTAETQDPKTNDDKVTLFNDPTKGSNQPSWNRNGARDVVGTTKDVVNWGLMTFFSDGYAPVYDPKVNVVTVDTGPGDVTAIEGYMRLHYYNSLPNPGLGVGGGTPTKGAIGAADGSLSATWDVDPKKACNRPYGVILCTDGQSNVTNTGSPVDKEWDKTSTPCAPDADGSAFPNFPPGAAEAMYLNAHLAGPGDAVVRTRTFAIGISTDISRCELNRIAYRGRTDANAPFLDAGFTLFDPTDPPALQGDARLPHIDPSPDVAGTTVPTNESGPGVPPAPNRFGPDQTPPDTLDYAFFANDARALSEAFQAIVNGSARGDYTTTPPVSGAAVGVGSTVVLTSAQYPLWRGHIKALDTSGVFASPPGPIVDLWDAGSVLAAPSQPWQPNPDGTAGHPRRQLYTWNPVSGALVEIKVGNEAAINTACGSACTSTPITSAIVDFMRGIDTRDFNLVNNALVPNPNKGFPRHWLLGPSINVTPAIVGPAQTYFQTGNVVDHKPFESTYANRHSLVWIGADDGFLHALDLGSKDHPGDGSEVIGLLPPNLIPNQVTLYDTFNDPDQQVRTDTGQNSGFRFDQHTWGVASSLRFADVWFPSCAPSGCYKTVGFLTEGPGGNFVAAIDITHPYPGRTPADPNYPADPNFNPAKPVDVLWTKTSSDYTDLFGSWSVPAVANDTFTTSKLTFGAGINPDSLYPVGSKTEQPANIFVVDPTSGALLSTTAIAPVASPETTSLVGHQTFTDSIFFQTDALGFQNDNLANLSLQGDENGRVNALYGDWTSPTSKVLIDLNAVSKASLGVDSPQPLYYSPSANGFGTLGTQIFALASGSFYETSPTVSGWNVNRTAPKPPTGSGFPDDLPVFVPTLFVAVNPNKITDGAFGTTLDSAHVISKVIGGETTGIPLQLTDPTYIAGVHTRLGIHSQITSSPLLVVDSSSTKQNVFFTVFDPDFGCNGFSYVVNVEFTISATSVPGFSATTVIPAAPGAAAGFVVTDQGAFIGQSGVGKGESTLVQIHIPTPQLPGHPNFRLGWWKEQK